MWKRKRARNKKVREIESEEKAKAYIEKVGEQAYLLWEADGKPESRNNYYWKLAVEKIKVERKNIPVVYRPW